MNCKRSLGIEKLILPKILQMSKRLPKTGQTFAIFFVKHLATLRPACKRPLRRKAIVTCAGVITTVVNLTRHVINRRWERVAQRNDQPVDRKTRMPDIAGGLRGEFKGVKMSNALGWYSHALLTSSSLASSANSHCAHSSLSHTKDFWATFWETATISSEYWDGHQAMFSVFWETFGKICDTETVSQNTG